MLILKSQVWRRRFFCVLILFFQVTQLGKHCISPITLITQKNISWLFISCNNENISLNRSSCQSPYSSATEDVKKENWIHVRSTRIYHKMQQPEKTRNCGYKFIVNLVRMAHTEQAAVSCEKSKTTSSTIIQSGGLRIEVSRSSSYMHNSTRAREWSPRRSGSPIGFMQSIS